MKKYYAPMPLQLKQKVVSYFLATLFVLVVGNLLSMQPANAQTKRYVKTGGNGTGIGSWDNASGSLQAMINASSPGDEVWVMKGQYQLAAGISFSMTPGVKIYGSFAGTEASLSDRVIGSSGADSSKLIGNGSSVVRNNNNGLDATALLDGFFITGGRALYGAGMRNTDVSPTISHCIFDANIATTGGMDPGSGGGGMSNIRSSPIVSDCILSNNSAQGNQQAMGGGMYCEQSSPTIINCKFSGNSVAGTIVSYGGGLFLFNNSSGPLLVNCSFSRNSGPRGAGIYKSNSSATLVNCSFAGNAGYAMLNELSGSPTLTNCIMWGNTAGGLFNTDPATASVSYSIMQGGYPGAGNLNINALFISQPTDLRLQSSSPAINMGNNAAIPPIATTDLAGNPRIYNSIADMGAYEYQGNASVPVPASGNKTASMTVSANGTGTFLTDANGLIASVTGDGTATSVAGNVTAKVWIEPAVPALNGQPYVARHYEITSPNNNTTGTVTLYYTQQDFTDFNNAPGNAPKLPINPADNEGYKANLRISKYSLTSSDGTGLMSTYHNGVTIINPDDANIVWNGNYWAVSFPVTGFSGFFVQTSLNALPVKWISSNAQTNSQGNAVISWKVQEHNVAGYEIQKSGDGIYFLPSGNVSSTGDGENNYSFTEAGHFTGTAYYRIKQTDKDGKTGFSSILKLQSTNAGKTVILVYPNPVNEKAAISINSSGADKIEWQLVDIRGVILQQNKMQISAGNSIISFNANIYPAGMYYLNLKGETINSQIKIIKL